MILPPAPKADHMSFFAGYFGRLAKRRERIPSAVSAVHSVPEHYKGDENADVDRCFGERGIRE